MGILSARASPINTLTKFDTACSDDVEQTPTGTPSAKASSIKFRTPFLIGISPFVIISLKMAVFLKCNSLTRACWLSASS